MRSSKDLQAILDQLAATMVKKHQDYGPMNIASAPGGAMNGLLVRMHDKMERLKHLHKKGDTPNYESVEDTLLDLANYAIIGLLVQRGQWEGLPNLNVKAKESSSTQRPADTISSDKHRQRSVGFYH